MRFLALLIAFFALEGIAFVSCSSALVGSFGRKWPATLHSDVQRDAQLGIQRIRTANKDWEHPKQFILGPSSAVPYWEASKTLPPERRDSVVSLISGSQVLIDAVRLVDTMQVPGSTVILVVTAHKFANMWFDRTMIETHYLNGAAGKYMIPSPTFEALWADYKKNNAVTRSVWTQPHWRMFQPFMPFAYYLSDLIDENVKRPITRIKSLFPASPATPAAAALPAIPAFIATAEAKAGGAKTVAEAIPQALPGEAGRAYEGLSDFKLKEFRAWRDFSKPQFDQGVDESFKMLELLIRQTKERRLKLVVAEAPMAEVEEVELLPYLKDYRRKFNELTEKYPGVTFIQHDTAKLASTQKYFADYIHVNKAGQDFYQDYLLQAFDVSKQCHRFADLDNTPAQLAGPPNINWNGKNILKFHGDEVIRDDLFVNEGRQSSATINLDAQPKDLKIGGVPFKLRMFVDTLKAESSAADLSTSGDPLSADFDTKGADFVNVSYASPFDKGATLALQWNAPDSKPGAPPLVQQFGRVATPFIWAFQPSQVSQIADAFCVNSPTPFLHPGYTWTRSEYMPLPANVATASLIRPPGLSQVEVKRVFRNRHYIAGPASTAAGELTTIAFPDYERSLAGAKMANSGMELTLEGVSAVYLVSPDHALIAATTDIRRRLGSFAPHTLGLRLADGSVRVLNVAGAELMDLDFHAGAKTADITIYAYHAHERLTFGYDLTPSKISVEGSTVHLFRQYRNHAITDYIPGSTVRLSVSDKSELAFPMWQPDGRLATVTFVEHADFQETAYDPLVMYGNAQHRVVEGQGILGNRLPYTKTVFLKGDPLAFPNTDPLGNKLIFNQPTVASDEKFSADLKAYVESGLVEIGAHQSGTTPFANQPGAAREALTILRDKFHGRVWTDHGGMPSNLSFNGWDRRQQQFYLLDTLEDMGIDYAWPGTDLYPVADPETQDDGDPGDYSLNMIRSNEANPIFFNIPMLSPSGNKTPRIRFFSTLGPTQTMPLSNIRLSQLLKGRGVSLLHLYPGYLALKYKLQGDKKLVTLKPEWNEGLRSLAKLRDEGLVHVAKTSDWLDFVRSMRALDLVRGPDGVLTVHNPAAAIKGASIGVIKIPASEPDGRAGCEVRYFALNAATGATAMSESNLVRSAPCGTPPVH